MEYKVSFFSYQGLHVSQFVKAPHNPYILYIHGGPGANSMPVEHLIRTKNFFDTLNYNLIFYDQRGCGRSEKSSYLVEHADNLNDLQEIYHYLQERKKIFLCALMGHSYGAKLLFDLCKNGKLTIPAIFVATACSILPPRTTNILLDLFYLKIKKPEKYQEFFDKLITVNEEKLWETTESMAPVFKENFLRPFFYWANLDIFKQYQQAQKEIDFSLEESIFTSVRKSLYQSKINFSVDIASLSNPCLWINGFQDFITREYDNEKENLAKLKIFYQSGHYPHLEENHKFCEEVNKFLSMKV